MFKSVSQLMKPRLRRHRRANRDGTAVVEAALCLPVVMILMLGTLEVCSGLFVSESITVCAYEGIRAGIGMRTTRADIIERANAMLDERGVYVPENDPEYGVTVTPDVDFSTLPALTPITVQIVVPIKGNSPFTFGQFLHPAVTTSVTMVREYDGENMPQPANP